MATLATRAEHVVADVDDRLPVIRQNAMVADLPADDLEAVGNAALESGQWSEARDAFAAALGEADSAAAAFGLAAALWWLGESQASVDASTRAYALVPPRRRRRGRRAQRDVVVHHLQVELRQLRRGQRVDRTRGTPPVPLPIGPLHAWPWIARAYRMSDLDPAAELTERAARDRKGIRRRRPRAGRPLAARTHQGGIG